MAGPDVFISYKRGDATKVEPIVAKLKELGFDVWLDTRLEAGPSFDEQIASKLKSAHVVLVCWTPAALESSWVRGEAAAAHESEKLVACFLQPTKLTPPFNLLQTENLAGWRGEDDHAGWVKTLTRIASLCSDGKRLEWARLMSEGDPQKLREWSSRQPPGPWRIMTRFWVSELGGATVAIPDASLAAARRRSLWSRWMRLRWWWKITSVAGLLATAYVGLIVWYQFFGWRPEIATYDVIFNGPPEVTEGSEVRFNGIAVGEVVRLQLDREDPNRVIARINVIWEAPVKTDSIAMQDYNRVNGSPYIQLLAGSPDQPLLQSLPGAAPPKIPAQTSSLEEILGVRTQQDLIEIQAKLYQTQLEYYQLSLDRMQAEQSAERLQEALSDAQTPAQLDE
ncbi:MAG: TIR domain-containing protein [Hyphomonadaceae bacterium]